MSGNGSVWGRVRSRLRAFPECLAACGAEVSSHRAGQHLQGRKGCAGRGGSKRAAGAAAAATLTHPAPSPGRGLRQVRAGVHGPGRPPEEGSVRAGIPGPAELFRRCGEWAPPPRRTSQPRLGGPAGLLSLVLCSVLGVCWFFRPDPPVLATPAAVELVPDRWADTSLMTVMAEVMACVKAHYNSLWCCRGRGADPTQDSEAPQHPPHLSVIGGHDPAICTVSTLGPPSIC